MPNQILIVLAVIVAVVLLYYISVYNNFRRLVVAVEESSSGIDVALAKRYDLITNMVATVKGYAKHEQETFSKVVEIRNNLENNRGEANRDMDMVLSRVLLLVESYPELKASENFLVLQKSLVDVEEHLQASRRLYNRNVAELNIKIHQFPTNMIANSMNVKEHSFFEAEKQQREAVQVEM